MTRADAKVYGKEAAHKIEFHFGFCDGFCDDGKCLEPAVYQLKLPHWMGNVCSKHGMEQAAIFLLHGGKCHLEPLTERNYQNTYKNVVVTPD